jgi:hypothetical protein
MSFGGIAVEAAIGGEVLRVGPLGAVEAAVMASQEAGRQQDEVLAVLQRDLAAARSHAQRAWKPYDAADPDNRLVVDALERRWDRAFARVQGLEQRIAAHQGQRQPARAATREDFATLATDLERLWHAANTDGRLKTRIVRTLSRAIVVDVDAEAGALLLVMHWQGGTHTALRLPRRRRGQHSTQTSKDIVAAVRVFVRGCSEDVIAGVLNRNGLRTGHGNHWTRERVVSLRRWHQIPCYGLETRQEQGWMNVTEAAAF